MSDDRDLTITEAFNELAAYLVEQSPGDADAGWERLKAAMDADDATPGGTTP